MNIEIDQNINENSFLDATIKAKIEAEEELNKNGGQSNTIWKNKFMNSAFYKNYQQHLVQRQEKKAELEKKVEELNQVKSEYQTLKEKYL